MSLSFFELLNFQDKRHLDQRQKQVECRRRRCIETWTFEPSLNALNDYFFADFVEYLRILVSSRKFAVHFTKYWNS